MILGLLTALFCGLITIGLSFLKPDKWLDSCLDIIIALGFTKELLLKHIIEIRKCRGLSLTLEEKEKQEEWKINPGTILRGTIGTITETALPTMINEYQYQYQYTLSTTSATQPTYLVPSVINNTTFINNNWTVS